MRPLLALVLAGLALCTCGASPPQGVVLVVVDTLRFDRLGWGGHARNTSPALDALAERGVRFERAYSTAPHTMPSVASMLTGLHPSSHGVQGLGGALSGKALTLAEILAERGWRTAGVVSQGLLDASHGYAQGHEVYLSDHAGDPDYVSTPGVTAQAEALLERFAAQERPFFLFVHYFDPHYNYRPHEGIDFAAERAGRLDGRQSIHWLRDHAGSLTPEEIGFVRDLYDEEIRFTDAGIGRLMERLRALGLEDETLVVFAADHGEEFLERGWIGHTITLYEELVHVPFVVAPPGGTEHVAAVEAPVSLASVAPTVLEFAGVEPAGFGFEAPSLWRAVQGGTPPSEPVFAEVDWTPARGMRVDASARKDAVVGERFKLVRDRGSAALELYDLRADPGERENLVGARPGVAAGLLASLEAHRARTGRRLAGERRTLSEEERARLRALGYLE